MNPWNIQVDDEITLLVNGEYAWTYEDMSTGVKEPHWYKVLSVDEVSGFFIFSGMNWRLDPKKYNSSWKWVKKVVQYKVDQEVDDDEELL